MREAVAWIVIRRVVSFALTIVLKLYEYEQVAIRSCQEVGQKRPRGEQRRPRITVLAVTNTDLSPPS